MSMRKAQKFIGKLLHLTTHNEKLTQSRCASPRDVTSSLRVPDFDNYEESGTIVLDTIDCILKVVKEVSAPFTPLQAAIQGICDCFRIYKVSDFFSFSRVLSTLA